ncbi:MAG: HAMP domain-containing protein [Deltaproteobacteria bacterium]
MIVICEECGKKYRIDPSKIKGAAARFKCRVCTHMIMVSKPQDAPAAASAVDLSASETDVESADTGEASAGPEIKLDHAVGERIAVKPTRKSGLMNLRTKMLLLFFFVPLLLMIGASLLYLWQFDKMAVLLTDESTEIVNQMAEEKIADLSTAVAIQCRLYLLAHPELDKADFMNDMGFKTLAVQKVGLTGYTALYEMPDADNVWRTWAHVNPKIIAIDMATLKKSMGNNFQGFWKIFTGVKGGKRSQGYYTWQDKDGKFREKFMVCTPVAGTPFVIAATTYLDEFTGPVKLLTDVAERISIGDLGIEIETRSRDEIGELAEAISRMQDSIRLSIERLRKRRSTSR